MGDPNSSYQKLLFILTAPSPPLQQLQLLDDCVFITQLLRSTSITREQTHKSFLVSSGLGQAVCGASHVACRGFNGEETSDI